MRDFAGFGVGVLFFAASVALFGASCGRRDADIRADPRAEASASPPPPSPRIPRYGPFTIPLDWSTCHGDDECVIVSVGCCDDTPVARSHEVELRAAFENAGRPGCPIKKACGPSKEGSWNGVPAKCAKGTCML